MKLLKLACLTLLAVSTGLVDATPLDAKKLEGTWTGYYTLTTRSLHASHTNPPSVDLSNKFRRYCEVEIKKVSDEFWPYTHGLHLTMINTWYETSERVIEPATGILVFAIKAEEGKLLASPVVKDGNGTLTVSEETFLFNLVSKRKRETLYMKYESESGPRVSFEVTTSQDSPALGRNDHIICSPTRKGRDKTLFRLDRRSSTRSAHTNTASAPR